MISVDVIKHSEAHLTSKNRSSKNLLSCLEALYVHAVPTRSLNILGDKRTTCESGSSAHELAAHLKNTKPPASFNCGYASRRTSRKAFASISRSSNSIIRSPRPAFRRSSFSMSVVGILD